jgi:hypothetical protein
VTVAFVANYLLPAPSPAPEGSGSAP